MNFVIQISDISIIKLVELVHLLKLVEQLSLVKLVNLLKLERVMIVFQSVCLSNKYPRNLVPASQIKLSYLCTTRTLLKIDRAYRK